MQTALRLIFVSILVSKLLLPDFVKAKSSPMQEEKMRSFSFSSQEKSAEENAFDQRTRDILQSKRQEDLEIKVKDADSDSYARRFEILFFISYPFTAMTLLASLQLYGTINSTGAFVMNAGHIWTVLLGSAFLSVFVAAKGSRSKDTLAQQYGSYNFLDRREGVFPKPMREEPAFSSLASDESRDFWVELPILITRF